MSFGNTQINFKEWKIDGNVLEAVCPNLPCMGEEGECGVAGCFFSFQAKSAFLGVQPDVLWGGLGTPSGHPRWQRSASLEVSIVHIRAYISSVPLLGRTQSTKQRGLAEAKFYFRFLWLELMSIHIDVCTRTGCWAAELGL